MMHRSRARRSHLRWLALLVVLVVGCGGATATPTPRPTPQPATPTPPLIGQGTEVETRPCEAATADADPLVPTVGYPGANLGPLEDDHRGRIPPVPINPEGEDLEVELPPAPPPSAYEPTDPRSLSVFGSYAFMNDRASYTAEPQVAVHGDRVQMSWNWLAATSSDLGASFTVTDPETDPAFDPVPGGFCCDQLVRYVPGHDLWVWVLQYGLDVDSENRQRIVVAHGDAAWAARDFSYWDLVPQALGYPPSVWLDRPEIATTDDYLFFSTNAYQFPQPDEKWAGTIVLRISLAELAAGDAINPTCMFRPSYQGEGWASPWYFDSIYPIRGATDTMYLAAHLDTSWLALWRWPDDSAAPTLHWVVDVADDGQRYVRYPGRFRENAAGETYEISYTCPRSGVDPPATADWCARSDDRVLGGWLAGGKLGLAWNASQDGTAKPYPWLWMVILDEAQLVNCLRGECVDGYPKIGYLDRAVQYIVVTPLPNGDVGGVVLQGGGDRNLTCTAIVHDALTEADPNAPGYWEEKDLASSDQSPGVNSGDYLGIAPEGGNDRTWSAACMTVRERSYGADSTVNFVRFGRLLNDPGR